MIESMIIAGGMLVALLYMTACSDKLDVQQMLSLIHISEPTRP